MMETSTLEGTLGGVAGDNTVARFLVLSLECSRPHIQPERFVLVPELSCVRIGRAAKRASRRDESLKSLRIDVPDKRMSADHTTLEWQRTHWVLKDNDSKNGTRVNGVGVTKVALKDGDLVEAGSTFFVYRELLVISDQLTALSRSSNPGPVAFTTMCAQLETQFEVLRRVATADVPIMITGETGTGKEVVARGVHGASGRDGAFVAVNCGAIAPTLVETELFGHKKGSFSGATQDKLGLVRASDKGTLFLDEVAELPEQAQVALLRVLQEREVRSIGDAHPTKVDLRVITATHRDVSALVSEGAFRADLFSRLAGFSVTVPPLRQRREDLGLLISALLRRLAPDRTERLAIHTSAARALFDHSWPMNVRELEQALRVALAVADDDQIASAHLPESVRTGGVPSATSAARAAPTAGQDDEQRLIELMRKHKGNLSAIARELSTSRSQVGRLAERFGLDPGLFRVR